jgi:hypothetical protein
MKIGEKNSSSTNPEHAEIKRLFDKYILAEKKALTSERDPLSLQIDKNCISYYEKPRFPAQLHYQILDTDNPMILSNLFRELWEKNLELTSMIPDMIKMAIALKNTEQEQSDDLSSFIYVMY